MPSDEEPLQDEGPKAWRFWLGVALGFFGLLVFLEMAMIIGGRLGA